ncbi:MAG: alpha/beta fold hydrolase, partial [Actinomycetota bacterium]
CPTMGVWSSRDFALTEAQMTLSEPYVNGPWRYERIDNVDHWVPVHAPDQLNRLLLEFLGPEELPRRGCGRRGSRPGFPGCRRRA